nr:MAG TPA: hypothetical protein [Caudoviricetes sp.]
MREMVNLTSIRSTSIIKITTNSSHFNKTQVIKSISYIFYCIFVTMRLDSWKSANISPSGIRTFLSFRDLFYNFIKMSEVVILSFKFFGYIKFSANILHLYRPPFISS